LKMTANLRNLGKSAIGRFPPGIWLLMGLDTLLTMGWSATGPFLALYLHNVRSLPMSVVGAIFLAGGLCMGATNLLGGMLSDRFGRRKLLLYFTSAAVLVSGTQALLIGLSAPVWLISLVYIASRCINGTIGPTVSAMVADISRQDRLAESYAMVRVGSNVGFAIGPAIGGFLMGYLSYGWLFSLSAFISLLVAALMYLFLRETFAGSSRRVDLRSTLAVAADRPFVVFAAVSVLLVLSIGHLGSTLSIFTVDRLGFSTAQYGLLLTTNGLLVVLFQYPVTRTVSRMTRAGGLVLGSLLYVIGYGSLGWFKSFDLALLTIVLITAGEVTLAPISSAVVAESAPPDKRGRYMGFFTLSQTMGQSLSPLFGGVLLDAFPTDSRPLWGIIASVGIAAALGFSLWGKIARKAKRQH
jgi:MFS family permease